MSWFGQRKATQKEIAKYAEENRKIDERNAAHRLKMAKINAEAAALESQQRFNELVSKNHGIASGRINLDRNGNEW